MMGENGTGKTTFIRLLAGRLEPDEGDAVPALNVSFKPQKISPKSEGTVRLLLHERIRDAYIHPQFVSDVMKPLDIENIIDQELQNLSGGELQRVALTLCLGKPADVFLIDEPSAYLDSEQRIMAAKVIKRFILHSKKTAFVVEHDFIMATYLADRVIVFEGQPGIKTKALAWVLMFKDVIMVLCILLRHPETKLLSGKIIKLKQDIYMFCSSSCHESNSQHLETFCQNSFLRNNVCTSNKKRLQSKIRPEGYEVYSWWNRFDF